ncbi:MAG: carbon-nitrogen hydrolase family protein [Fibrobacterota bacterium]
MKKLMAGLCQLKIKPDKQANLARAEELVCRATRQGARLVVLPEMFNCPYKSALFPEYAERVPDGPTSRLLSRLARLHKVTLVGGSIPEREGKRVYNTATVYDVAGRLVARHRKVHLFDVNLKNVTLRESDTLSPGNDVTVFSTPFGKMGLLVCYDARFPEIFRLLQKRGVNAVVIPAAFSVTTGTAHWHALLRMRAVDNQVYVLAASPARSQSAGYRAYGHSLVADPFGVIVAEAGIGETIVIAELNPARLKDVRARLPLLAHRRTDLYSVTEH